MYVYCLEERLTLTANHVTSRDTFSDAVGKRSTICVEWPKRIADRTNKTRIWCCCSGQWIEVYLSIVRWMIFVASSNGGGVNIRNLIEFKPHTHTLLWAEHSGFFSLYLWCCARSVGWECLCVCGWVPCVFFDWPPTLSLTLSLYPFLYFTSHTSRPLDFIASCWWHHARKRNA